MKNIKIVGWVKSIILIAVFTALNNLILGYNNPYVYILTALVGGCSLIFEATKKQGFDVRQTQDKKRVYIQKWVFIFGTAFTTGTVLSLFWNETTMVSLAICVSAAILVGFLLWRILK